MITIQKPGLLTTVQDSGRYGFQKEGVIVSGAMDMEAHRIANRLVGNSIHTPSIEMTLMGPVVEFEADALISICGGQLSPLIDGDPVPMWRPLFIKKGSELRFGRPKEGFRAYLAIAGGIEVPNVMGSASTYLRAGIGGHHGRALQNGDKLHFLEPDGPARALRDKLKAKSGKAHSQSTKWGVSAKFMTNPHSGANIRIIEGREFDSFSNESQHALLSDSFTIDSNSDRMGYRLQGPELKKTNNKDMISEAVSFGTIQSPQEGELIVLLADRQTTGGYPRVAQVASVDLPKIAQLKPGDQLNFDMITHKQAQILYLQREKTLNQLERGIHSKYSQEVKHV